MELVKLHPQSAAGRYWVDCHNCLDHGICADIAPANFRDDANEGASCYLVYKQPETEQEVYQCHEALRSCPVDAIHDNGTQSAV